MSEWDEIIWEALFGSCKYFLMTSYFLISTHETQVIYVQLSKDSEQSNDVIENNW